MLAHASSIANKQFQAKAAAAAKAAQAASEREEAAAAALHAARLEQQKLEQQNLQRMRLVSSQPRAQGGPLAPGLQGLPPNPLRPAGGALLVGSLSQMSAAALASKKAEEDRLERARLQKVEEDRLAAVKSTADDQTAVAAPTVGGTAAAASPQQLTGLQLPPAGLQTSGLQQPLAGAPLPPAGQQQPLEQQLTNLSLVLGVPRALPHPPLFSSSSSSAAAEGPGLQPQLLTAGVAGVGPATQRATPPHPPALGGGGNGRSSRSSSRSAGVTFAPSGSGGEGAVGVSNNA